MKMVNMKMSPADMAEDSVPSTGSEPFPYGLCLNLDTDELDKLGIKDLPEVGAEFYVCAIAKVTRVSASASEGQDGEQRGISLQITDLSLDAEMEHAGEAKETPKSEKREKGAMSVMSNAYGGS